MLENPGYSSWLLNYISNGGHYW